MYYSSTYYGYTCYGEVGGRSYLLSQPQLVPQLCAPNPNPDPDPSPSPNHNHNSH